MRAVLPLVHTGRDAGPPKKALLYRLCIEKGLLTRSQIAPNTFSRLVNELELLKRDEQCEGKRRLAFAKPYANDLWQADTLFGPYIRAANGVVSQTRLIAFLDDASRVCYHGEFFINENVDTLVAAMRAAYYKRGVPSTLLVDNGSIYTSKEIIQVCARVGCIHHAAHPLRVVQSRVRRPRPQMRTPARHGGVPLAALRKIAHARHRRRAPDALRMPAQTSGS